MKSAGMVLAAGGIAAANEIVLSPATGHGINFNWRIIPATFILVFALGGVEKVSEPFAKGLAGLILLSVLIVPYGNAPSPIESAALLFEGKK
jgi:hypothetical protein